MHIERGRAQALRPMLSGSHVPLQQSAPDEQALPLGRQGAGAQ
jgi:hypothetical protein